MIHFFYNTPWLYFPVIFAFSLLIGSFINVVIHRLPIMLERELQAELQSWQEPCTMPYCTQRYNLIEPRSTCPNCGHTIAALENIPLFSWLWLKGRCRACQAPISARYPVVELLTALLSLLVAMVFTPGLATMAALLLTWMLTALSFIDLDKMLLPDQLTLPLLWGGLLFNLYGGFTSLDEAVIGAVAGYLVLWSFYWIFRLLTAKEGMGYGDFKLLAALGACLGWQILPIVLLLSSLVGAVVGICLLALRKKERGKPHPFGPYLAIAGFIALLWGDKITEIYISVLSPRW